MKTLLTSEMIRQRVADLAEEINQEPPDVVVGVLTGSFIFVSDLARKLNGDLDIQFLRANSYDGRKSTGNVTLQHDPHFNVKGKRVLLVEDVVETGLTIEVVKRWLLGPSEAVDVKVCTLCLKNKGIEVDHYGFLLHPNDFIVGYGMDYNGLYRNLRDICVV